MAPQAPRRARTTHLSAALSRRPGVADPGAESELPERGDPLAEHARDEPLLLHVRNELRKLADGEGARGRGCPSLREIAEPQARQRARAAEPRAHRGTGRPTRRRDGPSAGGPPYRPPRYDGAHQPGYREHEIGADRRGDRFVRRSASPRRVRESDRAQWPRRRSHAARTGDGSNRAISRGPAP